MLCPSQNGQICIVSMLQNLQDLLHIPYNSYSVHKHPLMWELMKQINYISCLCPSSSVDASTAAIILSHMS